MGIYLDYNASAPIDERVLKTMIDVYRNDYGNADSRTHIHGENARKVIEKARICVGKLFNIPEDEVFLQVALQKVIILRCWALKNMGVEQGKSILLQQLLSTNPF